MTDLRQVKDDMGAPADGLDDFVVERLHNRTALGPDPKDCDGTAPLGGNESKRWPTLKRLPIDRDLTALLVRNERGLASQIVGQLMCRDREEVGLDIPLLVEFNQAHQETDERCRNHVFARSAVTQPAVDKGQEPPLESFDELPPRVGVARADLLDQSDIGFCIRHQSGPPGTGRKAKRFNHPCQRSIVNASQDICLFC